MVVWLICFQSFIRLKCSFKVFSKFISSLDVDFCPNAIYISYWWILQVQSFYIVSLVVIWQSTYIIVANWFILNVCISLLSCWVALFSLVLSIVGSSKFVPGFSLLFYCYNFGFWSLTKTSVSLSSCSSLLRVINKLIFSSMCNLKLFLFV